MNEVFINALAARIKAGYMTIIPYQKEVGKRLELIEEIEVKNNGRYQLSNSK